MGIKKRRLLIVGCGDIARRALPQLLRCWRVMALVREREEVLADLGVTQIIGDLDDPNTLNRLAGIAYAVLHTAPPSQATEGDPRTRRLIAVLRRKRLPQCLVYIGTTGVYGDCAGKLASETQPVAPQTNRAKRRVAAENSLRRLGRAGGCRVSLLRAPGIYAANRLPLERLRQGLPVVKDVFTNHIHADDLALACSAALRHGRPNRIINICDDSEWTVDEWFDRLAQAFHLPLPPVVQRSEAQRLLSPMQFSFMNESRRIDNRRMKKELGLKLRHPVIDLEVLTCSG